MIALIYKFIKSVFIEQGQQRHAEKHQTEQPNRDYYDTSHECYMNPILYN